MNLDVKRCVSRYAWKSPMGCVANGLVKSPESQNRPEPKFAAKVDGQEREQVHGDGLGRRRGDLHPYKTMQNSVQLMVGQSPHTDHTHGQHTNKVKNTRKFKSFS